MVTHFRELRVYRQAFNSAQEIFRLSRRWPVEEKYALTDQVRRSSRSICANLAEAWRKRRYPRHFVSKLSDVDAEARETQAWLDFALDCGYITHDQFTQLDQQYEHIIGGLVKMMAAPESWCGPSSLVQEDSTPYDADNPSTPPILPDAPPTPPNTHPPTPR